ncbi:MAG: hypothetical protein GTN73_02995 [Candidatus Aminicenantes bacterium]|nr:hypothetical protein [Candidatus Aminicenantes bacterium]
MAIHANQAAFVVDILGPFLWINEEGADLPIACDLGDIGLTVTEKTILIGVFRNLRKRTAKRED